MAGVDPITMALVGAGMGALTSDDPLKGAALGGIGGFAGGHLLGPMMGGEGALGINAVPQGVGSAAGSMAGNTAGMLSTPASNIAMQTAPGAMSGAMGVPQGIASGMQVPGGLYSSMTVPSGISAPTGAIGQTASSGIPVGVRGAMNAMRFMPKKKQNQVASRGVLPPSVNPGAGGSYMDIDEKYRKDLLSKSGFTALPSLASRF